MGDYVVLLHGLGRTANSMRKIEKYLQSKGYQVLNIHYPSTKLPVEKLVEDYVEPLIKEYCTDSKANIHFVTHSMGGILVRQYLRDNKPLNLGRVVMLAPPNRGSKLAEKLKNWWLFQWIFGPAGQQIGIRGNSIPRQLPKVDFQLGVIAGHLKYFGLGVFFLPGPNDGTVQVSTTKVKGMKDFCLVHRTHTFIMNAPEVWEHINNFIKEGYFINVKEKAK